MSMFVIAILACFGSDSLGKPLLSTDVAAPAARVAQTSPPLRVSLFLNDNEVALLDGSCFEVLCGGAELTVSRGEGCRFTIPTCAESTAFRLRHADLDLSFDFVPEHTLDSASELAIGVVTDTEILKREYPLYRPFDDEYSKRLAYREGRELVARKWKAVEVREQHKRYVTFYSVLRNGVITTGHDFRLVDDGTGKAPPN
jgi:hypothetical protein